MVEIAKSFENSSVEQEKNKDIRLQTLLKADRKRDEMFLAYQRQQAEADKKHELLMVQFLLQERPALWICNMQIIGINFPIIYHCQMQPIHGILLIQHRVKIYRMKVIDCNNYNWKYCTVKVLIWWVYWVLKCLTIGFSTNSVHNNWHAYHWTPFVQIGHFYSSCSYYL